MPHALVVDAILQAVADGSRRTMLDRLRHGAASAGELGAGLGISQPGVSRHLRVLREAGLVHVEDRGRQRVYSLAPEGLGALDDWLAPYRQLWSHRMDALATEIARGRKHPTTAPPKE